MKHILTFVLVALLGIGSAQACVKKAPKAAAEQATADLIGFVMDTTQALLPQAEIKIGKTTLRTSWDGRFVLTPALLAQGNKISVSCEGFEPKTVELKSFAQPLLVALTPKKGAKPKTDVFYTAHGGTRRDGVMYKTMMVGAAAPSAEMEDGLAVTEEAAVAVYDGAVEKAVKPHTTAPNNVSAGKLTAGEVNDFTKWSLWPNILDSTHNKFIKDWRIEPRQRYTVAVTDKYGYPIANYPVSLTDGRGNTLFQALTDNTGKAELWGNLMTDAQPSEVRVPEPHIIVDEPCNQSDAVDVVFVFDATGSMGDELRYLQAEMKDVIARAKDATGGLNIRTGAVVYRDHGDEYVTRISRLTDKIATTQAFIDKQSASGGGDYPEAIPEALMAALNSAGWDSEARTRIAFLVLDAPCHQDSTTIALLHEQILNAAALGVRIVPVVCSGVEKSGELLLRSIALATNGTSFFLTDDSGIGNTHLKPTTDSLKVEHLNDMLVRTIVEFSYMPDCTGHWHEEQIEKIEEQFIPNPFDSKDLENDNTIPHGPTTLYLLDISGKLITIYEGNLDEAGDAQLSALKLPMLPTGVYFVKAFYDGQWHTKKILVH